MQNKTTPNGTQFIFNAQPPKGDVYVITINWYHGDADAISATTVETSDLLEVEKICRYCKDTDTSSISMSDNDAIAAAPIEIESDTTCDRERFAWIASVEVAYFDENGAEYEVDVQLKS